MRKATMSLAIAAAAVVAAFLHYYLPQHDVVEVVGSQVKRMDQGENPATGAPVTRDVRYINTEAPDGTVRVYRNEDTGWGWPPYFKFNSGDLTAEAQALADTEEWTLVTHYGWRIQFLDMFPNVVGMRGVAEPDSRPFPWFNTIFLSGLAVLLAVGWIGWRRQRQRARTSAV